MRRWSRFVWLVLLLSSCRGVRESGEKAGPVSLTLATTTSTRDSGLLDLLTPQFEAQTGIAVRVIAVGSGQALEMGRRGDADLLLTHAPDSEKAFLAEGFGLERVPIMQNEFVVLGPPANAAKIDVNMPVADALRRLSREKAPFFSRGDLSGTHLKELQLWKQADVIPSGDWYQRAGAGMASTLRMASEKAAYTLADRATFLALRSELQLVVVNQGDPQLLNPYSAIIVHPQKHPHVHVDAANAFVEFLTSETTQARIAEFGRDRFDQPLFFPRERLE